jgi:polyhydroxybutyrate depolymerase
MAGVPRQYVVHAPGSYDGRQPFPLVVALHGAGGNAEAFLNEANWAAQAERCGFLVVAPEGLPLHPASPACPLVNPRVWNSGQFGRHRTRSHIDDVGFIVAALDDLAARCRVDGRRVYAVGYSSGGAMAFRLGAERADRFTAIASVAGLCWVAEPHPTRALPTLVLVGTMDPLVPLCGGMKVLPWEVHPSPPVRTVLSRWAAAIGCPTEPHRWSESPGPGVKVEDYGPGWSGCFLRVMYVKIQGHGWPGGRSLRPERLLGPDLSSLDATAAVWAFFQQWSL